MVHHLVAGSPEIDLLVHDLPQVARQLLLEAAEARPSQNANVRRVEVARQLGMLLRDGNPTLVRQADRRACWRLMGPQSGCSR